MTRTMTLEAGARLGRYEIVELLGVGGMGEVYRARDERLERQVAIKVLPQKFAEDETALARFKRESRAVAALSHPSIRSIYDIDQDGETTFAVMELLEGQTLDEELVTGAMPWHRAVELGCTIAEGLAAAHSKGIIHRDIKPQNIFLTEEGAAKILDFGLARIESPDSGNDDGLTATLVFATEAGAIMGTVQYMSPEQVRGQPADARSDVFSFGCVLYEMVTGKRIFVRNSQAETMAAILHEAPPPVSEAGVTIPAELQRIIDHCLEKNPEQRFQSGRDLPFAMRGLLSGAHPGPSAEDMRTPAPGTGPTAMHEEQETPSVAVLPFVNMSSDQENEFFSDGLAEELINAMSKIEGLKVASRTSTFVFKSKNQDIREIGEYLNVQTVLEGSVRKSGNRLRIRAQLVKVSDGYHLWSETFDRQMEDVFEVQDEIAENIAKALRIVLTEKARQEIKRVSTENVKAYEYYLRGRQACYQFQRQSLERARKLFARATEIDPEYVGAYAGIADCCSILYLWYGKADAHREEADKASAKALELDPSSAIAHASRGNALCSFDRFDEAGEEFEKALSIEPDLFEALYYYGRSCFEQGKSEKAYELYKLATEARPDDYQTPNHMRLVCSKLGREDEVESWHRKTIAAAEKQVELVPDDARALYFGAQALVGLGERERGLEWLERARAAEPEEPIVLYNVCCVYANAGDTEKALDCLDDAVTFGIGGKAWIMRDPDLDSLRGDARFEEILGRV